MPSQGDENDVEKETFVNNPDENTAKEYDASNIDGVNCASLINV